jgi:hypothetical protein
LLLDRSERDNPDAEILAKADYKDGGFKMTITAAPADEYLESVGEIDVFQAEGFTISNPEAKLFLIGADDGNFTAYKNNQPVGTFMCANFDDTANYIFSTFIYVSGDTQIKGTNDDVTYSVDLKKGWNQVYMTGDEGEPGTMTTAAPPQGVKWYYGEFLSIRTSKFQKNLEVLFFEKIITHSKTLLKA